MHMHRIDGFWHISACGMPTGARLTNTTTSERLKVVSSRLIWADGTGLHRVVAVDKGDERARRVDAAAGGGAAVAILARALALGRQAGPGLLAGP